MQCFHSKLFTTEFQRKHKWLMLKDSSPPGLSHFLSLANRGTDCLCSRAFVEQRALKGRDCVLLRSKWQVLLLFNTRKMMPSSRAKGQAYYKRFVFPKNHTLWIEGILESSLLWSNWNTVKFTKFKWASWCVSTTLYSTLTTNPKYGIFLSFSKVSSWPSTVKFPLPNLSPVAPSDFCH